MPANFSTLNTAIQDLVAQANVTVGAEDSAEVVIAGVADQITKAVTAALAADDAADQGSIDAATQAIAAVKAQFLASSDKLGAAIASTNPTPPTT